MAYLSDTLRLASKVHNYGCTFPRGKVLLKKVVIDFRGRRRERNPGLTHCLYLAPTASPRASFAPSTPAELPEGDGEAPGHTSLGSL